MDCLIGEYLPYLAQYDLPVIVNISGDTVEDYAELAGKLERAAGVAALEVNISCPNVKKGGMQFGSDPYMAAEVTRAVRGNTDKPVIVKLSPNVTSIVGVAGGSAAGADALSMINTLLGMAIDIRRRRLLGNIMGGLSGPAVRPVAVRAVWQVYREVDLPSSAWVALPWLKTPLNSSGRGYGRGCGHRQLHQLGRLWKYWRELNNT